VLRGRSMDAHGQLNGEIGRDLVSCWITTAMEAICGTRIKGSMAILVGQGVCGMKNIDFRGFLLVCLDVGHLFFLWV